MTLDLICLAPTWQAFLASNDTGEYRQVPTWLGEELHAYVLRGRGGLEDVTRAFLTCDLRLLMSCASDATLEAIRPIWWLIYNRTPGACWGNAEKVATWRRIGGHEGYQRALEAGITDPLADQENADVPV